MKLNTKLEMSRVFAVFISDRAISVIFHPYSNEAVSEHYPYLLLHLLHTHPNALPSSKSTRMNARTFDFRKLPTFRVFRNSYHVKE